METGRLWGECRVRAHRQSWNKMGAAGAGVVGEVGSLVWGVELGKAGKVKEASGGVICL